MSGMYVVWVDEFELRFTKTQNGKGSQVENLCFSAFQLDLIAILYVSFDI